MGSSTTRAPQAPPHLEPTERDGRPAVAVHLADQIVTVAARCPHRGAPLAEGTVVAGAFLECPWHGATFDLRTGKRLRGPACPDLDIVDRTPTGAAPAPD